jgi:hypothetical protein
MLYQLSYLGIRAGQPASEQGKEGGSQYNMPPDRSSSVRWRCRGVLIRLGVRAGDTILASQPAPEINIGTAPAAEGPAGLR